MSALHLVPDPPEDFVAAELARLREANADLESRLKARAAEVEFTNHEMQVFAQSVTQDLRAPLRAIQGFSKALRQKQGPYLDSDARHYLERIDANAAFMGRLIEELLRFSHVTQADLNIAPVDPAALARSAFERLRQRAIECGVEVEICEMPACKADPVLLQQVFASLIDNGIKFSRVRPHAKVVIGAHVEDGQAVYDVRDNGVGFDMQYADKLFGVFQRLHSHAEFEGVGVGLALVQRIVHRHGGRVWAEGEPGKGAAFHFTLGSRP